METKIDICPTCRRPFGTTSKRVCFECKKPINKYHKWTFDFDGYVRHRNCKNPEAYH